MCNRLKQLLCSVTFHPFSPPLPFQIHDRNQPRYMLMMTCTAKFPHGRLAKAISGMMLIYGILHMRNAILPRMRISSNLSHSAVVTVKATANCSVCACLLINQEAVFGSRNVEAVALLQDEQMGRKGQNPQLSVTISASMCRQKWPPQGICVVEHSTFCNKQHR